jgi:NADH:ubiquinone oxidoreductase subunit 2 (subunit N)
LALFIAGVVTGQIVLVLIAALNSAISAWYYLRLVGLPLMGDRNERSDAVESFPVPWARMTAMVLVIALILLPIFLAGLQSITAID